VTTSGPDLGTPPTGPTGGGMSQGAGGNGGSTASDVKERVGDVAGTAGQEVKEHAGAVAGTAREQAATVVDEGRRQVQDLTGQVRDEVDAQAAAQRDRLVGMLRDIGEELGSMSGGDGGPAHTAARQLAQRSRSLADWLDGRTAGDVVGELSGFARRRPGAFLLGAAALGMLAGRATRGATAAASSGGSSGSGAPADEFPGTTGMTGTTGLTAAGGTTAGMSTGLSGAPTGPATTGTSGTGGSYGMTGTTGPEATAASAGSAAGLDAGTTMSASTASAPGGTGPDVPPEPLRPSPGLDAGTHAADIDPGADPATLDEGVGEGEGRG
jgi:hypothetical protein